ncbi:MAG: hypothetical protein DRN81_06410 [Thermoproteota archaeon]|nr:MAG: hypothetical protein DRN81_06410 [Candidatus Korarchaeota archaeon]
MILILNPQLCVGCRICETTCSFVKYKMIQPSKARIKIVNKWHLGISMPVVCLNCPDAPCVEVCPTGSLSVENGVVVYNPETCKLCKACIKACPFGAIRYDEELDTILKCDLCGGKPACAERCPSGAIRFGEPTFKEGVRVDYENYRKYFNMFEEIKDEDSAMKLPRIDL